MNTAIQHPKRKLTPRQVLNIRSSALSNRALAKKYKLTSGVIHRIRLGFAYKDCGWPKEAPKRHVAGIAYNRKLTEEQVREIRIASATEQYKDIAARYDIDPSTVSNIMRGRTYKTVI